MNIKAELTAKGISVTGMIAVPSRSIVKPINLLVDTVADITTLNEIEANKIGIDYQTLEKDRKPTISLGGVFETYSLRDVILILETDSGPQEFDMNFINVSRFPVRAGRKAGKNEARLKLIPNLLGRDFLQKFGIKLVANFETSEAYLEYQK